MRIALAVDSFIYFANIRPNYKWTYFANTVVYTFPRPDKSETDVVFWNIKSNEVIKREKLLKSSLTFSILKFQRNTKHVPRLFAIASSSDHCVLATPQSDESAMTVPGAAAEYPHVLSLCNSLGTTVDTKQLSFEPLHVAMTEHYVFAASKGTIHK